jgi:Ser/Thr protein kinase RdoA (MazF antagonist)
MRQIIYTCIRIYKYILQCIIQNDPNEANIIIDEERTRVCGIIDFGDCLETCLVFEVCDAACVGTQLRLASVS